MCIITCKSLLLRLWQEGKCKRTSPVVFSSSAICSLLFTRTLCPSCIGSYWLVWDESPSHRKRTRTGGMGKTCLRAGGFVEIIERTHSLEDPKCALFTKFFHKTFGHERSFRVTPLRLLILITGQILQWYWLLMWPWGQTRSKYHTHSSICLGRTRGQKPKVPHNMTNSQIHLWRLQVSCVPIYRIYCALPWHLIDEGVAEEVREGATSCLGWLVRVALKHYGHLPNVFR